MISSIRVRGAGVSDLAAVAVEEEPPPAFSVLIGEHGMNTYDIAPHPGGEVVATCAGDGSLRLWDVMGGRLSQQQQQQQQQPNEPVGRGELQYLSDTYDQLRSCAFAPSGHFLATGGHDGHLYLYRVSEGPDYLCYLRTRLYLDDDVVVSGVAFHRSSQFAAVACGDARCRIVATDPCVPVAELGHHRDWVHDVQFHPDDNLLLTCAADHRAFLYACDETGTTFAKLFQFEHAGAVEAGCFSPAGDTLATASSDTTWALWDLNTYQRVFEGRHRTAAVRSVALSPDGRWATSSAEDGSVCTWDLRARRVPLYTHQFAPSKTLCTAYSVDGTFVMAGLASGEVRRMDLPTAMYPQIVDEYSPRIGWKDLFRWRTLGWR